MSTMGAVIWDVFRKASFWARRFYFLVGETIGHSPLKSKTIGLTSGASAPEKLIQDFISEVRKHCDVSIEEIITTKEKVTFKLPKSLN